jgi:hypothetical protein
MNGCKYIKQRIDEAEKADLLPFDVSAHLVECSDCERFAVERTALRELLAAGVRVSAPINFDAVLKAKLAERKDRRPFWWLGSPAFLRVGAATAVLVVMAFGAEYAGLFSDNVSRPGAGPVSGLSRPRPIPVNPDQPQVMPQTSFEATVAGVRPYPVSALTSTKVRRGDVPLERTAPAEYITVEDGGVVLVRGRNGELDVQMPTVSVGAQPLLYVSAGQRSTRNVGTSF